MKWCLRSRLASRYLVKAAEIRVDFRDYESIPDVYHKYKKTIVLFPALQGEEYNWEKLLQFDTICEHNLIISCVDVETMAKAKRYGFRFMLASEAHSGWDLKMLQDFGAEYAYVGIPLFFNLKRIRENEAYTIKLRAIPTVSYNHHYPYSSGICGQWIRPEDVEAYEDYIDIMEFEFCEVTREETLFKIYAEQKEWSTRLDILVEDLGSSALNRMIPDSLVEARLECNHRCMNGGTCHLCETVLKMTEEDFVEKIHKVIPKQN